MFPQIIPNAPKFNLSQSPMLYEPLMGMMNIVEQPQGKPAYVSPNEGELTHFGMPQNNYGLLAHKGKAGKKFSELKVGDVLYGNRSSKQGKKVVKEIREYQALQPDSPYSAFVDLATNKQYSADELYRDIYDNGKGKMILQTCIDKDNNPTWGRMFIIAE